MSTEPKDVVMATSGSNVDTTKVTSRELLNGLVKRLQPQFVDEYKGLQESRGFGETELNLLTAEADTLSLLEVQRIESMSINDMATFIDICEVDGGKNGVEDSPVFGRGKQLIEQWNRDNPNFDFGKSDGRRILYTIINMFNEREVIAPILLIQKELNLFDNGNYGSSIPSRDDFIRNLAIDEKRPDQDTYSREQVAILVDDLTLEWIKDDVVTRFHQTLRRGVTQLHSTLTQEKRRRHEEETLMKEYNEFKDAIENYRHRNIHAVELLIIEKMLLALDNDQRFEVEVSGEYYPKKDILIKRDGEEGQKIMSIYYLPDDDHPTHAKGAEIIYYDETEEVKAAFADNHLEGVFGNTSDQGSDDVD